MVDGVIANAIINDIINAIMMKTNLEKIPESCVDCQFEDCRLPLRKNGYSLKNKYLKKRHEDCPLVKIRLAYLESER